MWLEASIKKHFADERPSITPTESYRKKQRSNKHLRARMKLRGHHVGQLKRKQATENLKVWAPQTGHDVRQIFLKHNPKEEKRNLAATTVLVCATCRRRGNPIRFQQTSCADEVQPIPTQLSGWIQKMALQHPDNHKALREGLNMTDAEVAAADFQSQKRINVKRPVNPLKKAFGTTYQAAQKAGHTVVEVLPPEVMRHPDSKAKKFPKGYITCTSCLKVNPLGSVKIWTSKCQGHDPSSAGFSAKRRYWNSLVAKQQQALSRAWGKSLKQSKEMFQEVPRSKRSRKSKEVNHDDKVGARIGEASHPGPRSRQSRSLLTKSCMWSCNTQGARKAWTLLDIIQHSKSKPQEVILLQESSFAPAEWNTFQRSCLKVGYRGFFSGASNPTNRNHGGAAVLVHSSLPCRPAWSFVDKGGSAQAVWLGPILVVSTYLAPSSEAETVSAAVAQTVHALAPGQQFILGGDFNATPNENPFNHLLIPRQFQIHASQTPTRWDANRCIDYYIGNCTLRPVTLLPDVVADHKIVATHFQNSVNRAVTYQQANVARILPKNAEETQLIQAKVAQLWPTLSPNLPQQWSEHLDQDWQQISDLCFRALVQATQEVAHHLIARMPSALLRRAKPGEVILKQKEYMKRHPAGCVATHRQRVLRRLLGRLREAQRHLDQGSENTDEAHVLWAKIHRCPLFNHAWGIQRNIRNLEDLMKIYDAEDDGKRLSRWKTSMQEDKAMSLSIKKTPESTPSSSTQESLHILKNFWAEIWDRPVPDWNAIWSDLTRHTPLVPATEPWPSLTPEQLRSAARSGRGSSPGFDGWRAEELLLFCDDMWLCISSFFDHCEHHADIPRIWKCIRQVHIPKGKPPEADASMLADNMRPIAVMSMIWRICSRARFKQDEVQRWIKTSTPDFMFGGIPQKGVEDAIGHILQCDMKGWPVGTLDLTKAFDYSDPALISKLFRHQGMPPGPAGLISALWCQQIRYLQINDEFLPHSHHVRTSLPQGDCFSMLGMCALLIPIANHVQAEHPSVAQALYADDRSFSCPSAAELWQVRNKWHEWSHRIGLKENPAKEQFFHRTSNGCSSLVKAGCSQETVSSHITLLGFQFMGVKQRKASNKESTRLADAKEVLRKCACLPGTRARKAAVARVCAPAKASWGWLFRRPSQKENKAFFTAAKTLHRWPKQSAVPLLYLFGGHWWDLSFNSTVTAIRILTRHVSRTARPLCNWPQKMSGWTGTLRKGMQELGFLENGFWSWTHPLTDSIQIRPDVLPDKATDVLSHRLRDAWRTMQYHNFLQLDRRDSAACADIPCDLNRINLLKKQKLSTDAFATITGAFISPECRNRMGGTTEVCPYCQANCATLEHILWLCKNNPHRDPDLRPIDALQRRMAWPSGLHGRHDHDQRIIMMSAAVRRDVLELRYADEE